MGISIKHYQNREINWVTKPAPGRQAPHRVQAHHCQQPQRWVQIDIPYILLLTLWKSCICHASCRKIFSTIQDISRLKLSCGEFWYKKKFPTICAQTFCDLGWSGLSPAASLLTFSLKTSNLSSRSCSPLCIIQEVKHVSIDDLGTPPGPQWIFARYLYYNGFILGPLYWAISYEKIKSWILHVACGVR